MDINQQIHNIEYLCRICLQEFSDIDSHLISFDTILEELDEISYLQAFELLTGFMVKDNEPQKICFQCKVKMESAYDLKKVAGTTQKILEKNLMKIEVSEVKVEIKDFSDDYNKDDIFNSDSDFTSPIKVVKKAPKEKSYKCDYCDRILPDYSGMVSHLNRVHRNVENVICEFCCKKFYSRLILNIHLGSCKKNPTAKSDDHKNYKGKHKQKIVCPVCGILAEESHIKIHEKRSKQDVSINQEPCICDICGTTRQNRTGMAKHMKFQHLGHKVKCKDCENFFLGPNELDKHIRRMHKFVPREYHCRKCPFTTTKEHTLRLHRKVHNEARIFNYMEVKKFFEFEVLSDLPYKERLIKLHDNDKSECYQYQAEIEE
uniref:CSON001756 protein n=1 Tax=Culicoides sonorensis TaxID=179676 RepID=A0A336LRE9_CULSO